MSSCERIHNVLQSDGFNVRMDLVLSEGYIQRFHVRQVLRFAAVRGQALFEWRVSSIVNKPLEEHDIVPE